MKGKAIRNIITNIFCWILFLQIINLSINPPDFREFKSINTFQRVDFPFHEVETIYELVAEGVFDENIPDTEDKDTNLSFNLFDLFKFPLNDNCTDLMQYTVQHFSFYKTGTSLVQAEPNAPPPKSV